MAKSNKINLVLGSFILLLIVYAIYIIYVYYYKTPVQGASLRIATPEAKAKRFGLIIDVRTPKERQLLGYYPNSIPISLEKLQSQVPLDISNKNTWILIYSNADSRASMAANILYKMGYKNVRYINESYLSLMPGSS